MLRMMVTLLLASALAWAPAEAQTRYLRDVPDLPLPAGFFEPGGAAVVFDKAEGRVVRTWAEGDADTKSGRAFYWAALPELGWRRISGANGGDVYIRGSERLTLTFVRAESGRRIEFSLAPRG